MPMYGLVGVYAAVAPGTTTPVPGMTLAWPAASWSIASPVHTFNGVEPELLSDVATVAKLSPGFNVYVVVAVSPAMPLTAPDTRTTAWSPVAWTIWTSVAATERMSHA